MIKVAAVTLSSVLVAAAAVAAAPAGFLILDGIHGESRTRPGAIEAQSMSSIDCASTPSAAAARVKPPPPTTAAAAEPPPAVTSPRDPASGLATGKRTHKPFVITKEIDKSSPMLAKAAASGTPIPKAVVEQGGLKFELEGILIGLIKPASGGDRPTESVTLNFAKCTRR